MHTLLPNKSRARARAMLAAAAVGTVGVSFVRKLSEQAAEEEDDDGFQIPFAVVILVVALYVLALMCGCTCFVLRCFAPEVTQGPSWEHNSLGKRVLTPWGADEGPWLHELNPRAYPDGVPEHNPNNPKMRPKNFQDPNNQAYRDETQLVRDQKAGLHLMHNGRRLGRNSEMRPPVDAKGEDTGSHA